MGIQAGLFIDSPSRSPSPNPDDGVRYRVGWPKIISFTGDWTSHSPYSPTRLSKICADSRGVISIRFVKEALGGFELLIKMTQFFGYGGKLGILMAVSCAWLQTGTQPTNAAIELLLFWIDSFKS
jgi:hypothetical protein